jgi:alcohol dehydrogenase
MKIPEYYEYTSGSRILSGLDALLHLPFELTSLGVKKPAILSDAVIRALPFYQKTVRNLRENGFSGLAFYEEIPADAPVDVAETIAELYRKNSCDGIIAIGGGSVLDCAKAVNLLVSCHLTSIDQAMGLDHITKNLSPLIAVPTTSGTGSEATRVAVVSDRRKDVKMEIITGKIIPDVAVLDPEATLTLPPRITASTGMDALTHAIEALYSLQTNPISRSQSIAAVELILGSLEKAVKNPGDREARLALANGSYLAGSAFSSAMVGAIHAIGHAIGAVCHAAHGDVMTVLLPAVLRANLPVIRETLEDLLIWIGGAEIFAATPQDQRAEKTIALIENLRSRLQKLCGLPGTLRDLKISRDSFPEITRKAMDDGACLTNPVPMSEAWVTAILESSL